MVYSLLELTQVLLLDMLPNCTITLTLSSNRKSEVKNGLFSGLGLYERLLRSLLPLEALLMSVIHAASG